MITSSRSSRGQRSSCAELTKWKQEKATSILESPAFTNLDLQKNPRKAWFEMIVRKFTNYRNCVYRKSATAIPTSALANEKANPLLKFSSITSGCQLFAKDHSESIPATSRRRLLDTEIRPSEEPIRILRHSVLLGWNHCRPAIDHQAQQFTPSPIVDDTELSESPSPVFGSSPLEHSTPVAAIMFACPTADPSLAPKGCEKKG
ncbi:hypothetical protein B0H14DRAFT_3427920 [Mycena olivaceomarginata]|nr:hypothetical protein B0H14DRAFT_3427920 [Mycena olivaceomarginata]